MMSIYYLLEFKIHVEFKFLKIFGGLVKATQYLMNKYVFFYILFGQQLTIFDDNIGK